MNALTDTQLVILSKASQRDDRAVELPPKLKGGAAKATLSKLLRLGLVKEVVARPGMPVWRRDEDGSAYSLLITPAGLEALGIGAEGTAPQDAAPSDLRPDPSLPADSCEGITGGTGTQDDGDMGGSSGELPAMTSRPREGSKTAALIGMLQRQSGATIAEMTAALGWLPHTARAALTGLRKRGYPILKEQRDDQVTAFRIEPAEATASPPDSDNGSRASRRVGH